MLAVSLLGQFAIRHDGESITISSRNAQSLFAYLLLYPGQAQRRERLAGLLWPDSSEENARSNLRHELWRLRKALGPPVATLLQADDLAIAIDAEVAASVDVHRLEAVPAASEDVEELMRGVDLYRGELLAGFYHDWVLLERERVQGVFEARSGRLLELLLAQQRWTEAVAWANHWIAVGQPWPEPAYRALMAAYAHTGEIARAVQTYERLAQGLDRDLALPPSEQTAHLIRQIREGWHSGAITPGLPPPASPSSATARGSNGRTVAGSPPPLPRSNLPRPLTSFIGRERESDELLRLVNGARLVTVTGAGGVGKTRLAIEVARRLAPEFRDGVRWVNLAPLPPGEALVAQAVAKSVRVPEQPGLSVVDGLVTGLQESKLLLVIDNCEHLIVESAAIVERLLTECPHVSVLATSREPLGVSGERAWLLPPLSLPSLATTVEPGRILQTEAVRLFMERAADVLPGFDPASADAGAIAHICVRLDGMPLAIELAAARMSMLSAGEIAVRLGSRFSLLTAGRRTALPRHQTLQAAIEWSYDLLSEPEKCLFRRLAVFSATFTLEAAEATCAGQGLAGDGVAIADVLSLLGRLVDKSLLVVAAGPWGAGLATRYRFLETIRSFGQDLLAASGETQWMREQHADYYVHLVETAEPKLLSTEQSYWYSLLQAESANIRAAVEWSTETGSAESSLRIIGGLLWFWWSHGSPREGVDLTLKALARPVPSSLQQARVRATNTAAFLLWVLGDLQQAKQHVDEALSLQRDLDEPVNLAWSLQMLGLILAQEGHYERANKAMGEGVQIARRLGDLRTGCFSLAFLGDVALQQGQRAEARRIYAESAVTLLEIGNHLFTAYPLRRLAYLALEENDAATAWYYLRESLALNREGKDWRAVLACITGMAALALHAGELPTAARLLGMVESQLEAHSIHLLFLDQNEARRIHRRLRSELDEARFSRCLAEGADLDEVDALALVTRSLPVAAL